LSWLVETGGWRSDTIVLSSRSVGGWMWTCLCGRWGNHRVMRWEKGAKQGTVIVGGNGQGEQANQLSGPVGLFFDRHGHLYVADTGNHRVQRFSLC
jgi:hypothetical protein